MAGRLFRVLVGTVVAVAALRAAEPVLVPLVAGLFLAALAQPMHRRLRDALPGPLRWLGLVASMLVVTAGVAAFVGLLAVGAHAVATELRERGPAIERQLTDLRTRAAAAGVPLPALPGVGSGTPAASPPDPATDAPGGARGGAASGRSGGGSSAASGGQSGAWRLARSGVSVLGGALAGLALALGFAALGMAETDEARRRIGHLRGGREALAAMDEAAPTFRRYVWVKSLTSAVTGLATGLASLALGVPLAWVWGLVAFLFEYVPTIGSVLAVAPPVLMALADDGPGRAGLVLLVVGTVQIVLGNVVDPRLEGRLMAVSPFGVLLSIVFWGWLWGAVGALLAVPLTIAVVIACRHVPAARGVATVVAGDGVDGDGSDARGAGRTE
jgi:predicted PurR-regulated permease PerM